MIVVNENLLRATRRVDGPVDNPRGSQIDTGRGGGGGGGGGEGGGGTKVHLIDSLLGTSPPLPAPPIMQPAQIAAQERELELQMSALQLQQQQKARGQRPSVNINQVDPAFAVIQQQPVIPNMQPPASNNKGINPSARPIPSTSSPRLTTQTSPNQSGPDSDWFAKVEVAPRPKPVATASSNFVPSSLSAALNDSGILLRQSSGRNSSTSIDQFSRIQTRAHASQHRSDNASPKGRNTGEEQDSPTVTIFLHPYSDLQVRPTRIRLQLPSSRAQNPSADNTSPRSPTATIPNLNPTTDDVIANLLHKWQCGELRANFGLRANLQASANEVSHWCLKMVDEDSVSSDEDDESDDEASDDVAMDPDKQRGMPEDDLPPLERFKPIRMFGVETLAMVVAEGHHHKKSDAEKTKPLAVVTQRPSSPVSPHTGGGNSSSPSSASSATSPNPSSRNPSSNQSSPALQSRTARITPPSIGGGIRKPKNRTVSVFSGTISVFDQNVASRQHSSSVETYGSRSSNTSFNQTGFKSDSSHHDSIPEEESENVSPPPDASYNNEKIYLTIHIGDHESHVIGLPSSALLAEALPLLSQKKESLVAMKIENYRFTYLDPLLKFKNERLKDMSKIKIGELASLELNLIHRANETNSTGGSSTPNVLLPSESNTSSSSSSSSIQSPSHGNSIIDAPSLSSFQFTLDTASVYTEYKVIKTNQRGKRQHRIFGVDRYKIYNKTQYGQDENESGMFSFFQRRISSEQGVSRAFRLINTIASVHVVSLRPTCFCISFKQDSRKDSPIASTREYETETKMEAAEIVAKLRFLMHHAQNENPTIAAASMAPTGGILTQN